MLPQLRDAALDVLRKLGPAWLAIGASALLSIIGVYCIDVAEASRAHGGELSPVALRQALYSLLALSGAVVIALPHYRWLGYASWVLMAFCVLLLVFLLIPFVPPSIVRARNGARSWIDLGPADVQPSELAKIAYVLVLGWYLRFRKNHRTMKGLLPPAFITALPVGLILLQPDLGTACLFIPALFAVLVA